MHFHLVAAAVSVVGTTIQMVQEAAVVPNSEIFWRQNRAVLLLAGILYEYAHLSGRRRIRLLSVRHCINQFG